MGTALTRIHAPASLGPQPVQSDGARRLAFDPGEQISLYVVTRRCHRFGSLGLDEDGDIWFMHQLPADGLTKAVHTTVVKPFSRSSDEIPDELAMRFS